MPFSRHISGVGLINKKIGPFLVGRIACTDFVTVRGERKNRTDLHHWLETGRVPHFPIITPFPTQLPCFPSLSALTAPDCKNAKMPSSLFAEMERNGSNQENALDDQRALQLALDQLSLLGLDNDENGLYDNESSRKKSVNMTECVPVPSSEHVAEIVGRQGEEVTVFAFRCFFVRIQSCSYSQQLARVHVTLTDCRLV